MTKMAESVRATRLPLTTRQPAQSKPLHRAKREQTRSKICSIKLATVPSESFLLEAEQMAERTADRLVGASGAGLGEPTMPQPIENPSVKLREEGSPLPQTVKSQFKRLSATAWTSAHTRWSRSERHRPGIRRARFHSGEPDRFRRGAV